VEKEIQKGVTFDADDYYCADRKDLDYCSNDAELQVLWRQRVKNDLLYYRLMQKIMVEKSDDPKVQADLQKRWFKKSPEDKVRSRLHDVYNAASQFNRMDILGVFLSAAAQVYGPHSYYSTPKQVEDFDIQFSLSLTGIGATLTNEDGYVKIVNIVPNGPADKDGRLKVEDRIVAVTQEGGEPLDIIDMSVSNAVKYIRGPANTKVTLTVLPAAQGASAMPVDITIVRGKVELQEEAAKGEIRETVLENGTKKRIGIITLDNFYMDFEAAGRGEENYRSCTRDVRAILVKFNAEKVDAVVLDLRNNSG
jgi:carboxyl-terminal processing protease